MSGTQIFVGAGWVPNPRLPMVTGVVSLYDGLIPNRGSAQASYVDGWNRADGYEVEVVFRTPKDPVAYELARRYVDGKGWFLRVTADGNIALSTGFGSDTSLTAYATTSTPLKDTWGGKLIGVKVRLDLTTKKLRRWISLDGGTTYTEVGTGSTISDAAAAKGVQPTTAPFVVVSAFGGNATPIPNVVLAALRDIGGTSLIGIRFGTTWPPYASSYQSPSGSTWTLAQGAFIGSTTVPSPA